MKREIEDFYSDLGLGIEKLIARRQPDIIPDQIKVAASKVYHMIKKGLKIKPINIAKLVHSTSKDVDVEKIKRWYEKNSTIKTVITEKESKDIEFTIKIKGLK